MRSNTHEWKWLDLSVKLRTKCPMPPLWIRLAKTRQTFHFISSTIMSMPSSSLRFVMRARPLWMDFPILVSVFCRFAVGFCPPPGSGPCFVSLMVSVFCRLVGAQLLSRSWSWGGCVLFSEPLLVLGGGCVLFLGVAHVASHSFRVFPYGPRRSWSWGVAVSSS
jgi:hypothetical protein